MSSRVYFPILKTTVSEIRALRQLDCSENSNVHPIFELTKSRKSKHDEIGNVYKRIEEITEIVKKNKFILDLTSEGSLSNTQIESFFDDHNNFENWRLFIRSLKDKELNVYPVVQAYDDTTLDELSAQMKYFFDTCGGFSIRLKPVYLEMDISRKLIQAAQNYNFILIFDLEYVDEDNLDFVTNEFSLFLEKCISNSLNVGSIILCSSSFPSMVNHYNKFEGEIKSVEKVAYQEISKKFPQNSFFYGDYGSVHPFRNETTAYNWVPRIDYPLLYSVVFCRKQREVGGYKDCANRLVNMPDFINNPVDCWGYREILDACSKPNGNSPSYWISARINLHITRTLEWLST
ncbi:beta family protein [Shewanella sp. SM20]|uniref:beta family protein n=1 Tax=Shewanella sp. SM20 TaxID=2912792 RepID=UPI0021DA8844|nr:beta family protein [Shewanella sp. SM20]MCU8090738.1 beta family protein [Shewanella sp. SM20]